MFSELREILAEAFDLAPDRAEFVITRYRNENLRTQFNRILKHAGVTPWPKPFQNLRSSRETELANAFPLHVVTEWLGNTPSIAMKHYLTTTDDHFQRAIADSFSGATVGAVNGQVVQLSVLSASADGCPQLTQATTGSEVAPKSLIFPTILDVPQYPRQDSNLRPWD